MAFSRNNQDGLMSDINVTPFVDVMLVLLIIFMVTAPMMIQGVNVSLPETENTDNMATDEDQLIVIIDSNNKILINDYEVGIDFLRAKLIKIFENRSTKNIFLKADKNIPYGTVVRVMSEIKGAGVKKLGMVTLPLETSEAKL
ncbi:MAG: protein TolR [Desulfobacterales bacterium CG23_combo_of_CG06-09_8_20_14_all_51_8]|nr:MAG: protein TolR [Desulfobacterales bacterium CG23_combo_of_CG06-09_8_20_14_all_51_8]